MNVTLVYVTTDTQYIQELEVLENSTIKQVIEVSGLLKTHPEVSLDNNKVGIFNEIVSLESIVKEHDRIEIYRSLTMDPMQARRMRANLKA